MDKELVGAAVATRCGKRERPRPNVPTGTWRSPPAPGPAAAPATDPSGPVLPPRRAPGSSKRICVGRARNVRKKILARARWIDRNCNGDRGHRVAALKGLQNAFYRIYIADKLHASGRFGSPPRKLLLRIANQIVGKKGCVPGLAEPGSNMRTPEEELIYGAARVRWSCLLKKADVLAADARGGDNHHRARRRPEKPAAVADVRGQAQAAAVPPLEVRAEPEIIGQLESNALKWEARAAGLEPGHKRWLMERRARRSRDLAERLRHEARAPE